MSDPIFKTDLDKQRTWCLYRWWTYLRRPMGYSVQPDGTFVFDQGAYDGAMQMCLAQLAISAESLELFLQRSPEGLILESKYRALILTGGQSAPSGGGGAVDLAPIQAQLTAIQASLKALTTELHTPGA